VTAHDVCDSHSARGFLPFLVRARLDNLSVRRFELNGKGCSINKLELNLERSRVGRPRRTTTDGPSLVTLPLFFPFLFVLSRIEGPEGASPVQPRRQPPGPEWRDGATVMKRTLLYLSEGIYSTRKRTARRGKPPYRVHCNCSRSMRPGNGSIRQRYRTTLCSHGTVARDFRTCLVQSLTTLRQSSR
jgi:hypothetical protein